MIAENYLSKLNSWFIKFRRYAVTYKNGFFQLSNLANSPYTMVESFDKMPFCKHNREKKLLHADTPFLKVQLYYYELDPGLWIYVSDLEYRKNQLMKNLYDKNLPMDFHFINLHYREKTIKSKSMLVNGMLLTDKTWSVFKTGTALSDYHFKDSKEKNITIYFTEKWLKEKFFGANNNKYKDFEQFIESENRYLLIADNDSGSNYFYNAFLELLLQQDNSLKGKKVADLVADFFKAFNSNLAKEDLSENHFKLSDKDRKFVQRTEKILLDNLITNFPGIEEVANKIGVSATKLKSDFKTVHNKTLYQFYSYHQMQLAHELISQKKQPVKEVAKLLGYENPSKFSARFKEEFGVSPSSFN